MRFFHKKKKKKPTTLALDEGLEQGPFFPEPLDTKQAVWFYCTVAQWLRAACPQLKEEAWEAIAGTLESEHGVTCVGHLAKTRSGAFLEAGVPRHVARYTTPKDPPPNLSSNSTSCGSVMNSHPPSRGVWSPRPDACEPSMRLGGEPAFTNACSQGPS